jgi:hypothetical protein
VGTASGDEGSFSYNVPREACEMSRGIDVIFGFDDLATAVVIPAELMTAFAEMVRHGMAFERGQPKELYEFADKLSAHIELSRLGRGSSI